MKKSGTILILMTLATSALAETRTYTGMVSQADCNRPTGFGMLELKSKNGSVLESRWLKVRSAELCSREIPSALFLGPTTVLADLAARNTTSQEMAVSSVRVEDGFVTGIRGRGTVNAVSYLRDVESTRSFNQAEVFGWYFSNQRDRH